jgi:hypothetical protein
VIRTLLGSLGAIVAGLALGGLFLAARGKDVVAAFHLLLGAVSARSASPKR